MDEFLSRQLIRRKLHEGNLPRGQARDIWAAPGGGQTCDGCDEPIARSQEIGWRMVTRDWISIQFHDDCFQIWDAERLALPPREA
jgi:hypothetical protein